MKEKTDRIEKIRLQDGKPDCQMIENHLLQIYRNVNNFVQNTKRIGGAKSE